MREVARYRRKCKSGSLHDSRRITQGQCPNLSGAGQKVADDLVEAGVRIIFNYPERLLDVPSDVTVHTSNPAVELLHALYFHLA